MGSKYDEDTHDAAPAALRLLYACSAWMILLAASSGTNENAQIICLKRGLGSDLAKQGSVE